MLPPRKANATSANRAGICISMNLSDCRSPSNKAVNRCLSLNLFDHETCSLERYNYTSHVSGWHRFFQRYGCGFFPFLISSSDPCRAATKLLCLSVLLLALLLLTGCAIPERLPIHSYPVRATLEVTVEGQPVKVTRDFRCEEFVVQDFSCPGCVKWRTTQKKIAEPLPSGGALLLSMGIVCDYHTGELSNSPKPDYVIWADDLERPNRLEFYEAQSPALSDVYAKKPKILVHSLKFSLDRIGEGEAKLSDMVAESKATWLRPLGEKQKQESDEKPRELVSFSVAAFPRLLWLQLPWVAQEVERAKTATEFRWSPERHRELRELKNKANKEFEKGTRGVPVPVNIPGKYLGENVWGLDEDHIGIRVFYYVGIGLGNEANERYRNAAIQVGSGKVLALATRASNYVFVPERTELFTGGGYRTIIDYSQIEN